MSQAGAANLPVLEPPARATAVAQWRRDLIELTKLRITFMVVVTAWIGYAVGGRAEGAETTTATLWWALVGTALSCMGAGALNQLMERDTDALMHRTRNRPLPAGRITPAWALALGLLCAVSGVMILALGTHPLAALVSAFTLASYVLLYTPLKRRSSLSTIVGAVPGALPPVIGYTAVTGHMGPEAWVMFGIMFLWQLPHFLAIAWLYREDFARAGFPMLPVLDPSGRSTFRQVLIGCVTLVPMGLMPTLMGLSGAVYFFGALGLGLMFLCFGVALAWQPSRGRARALFFASLVYLPAVLALLMLDRV